MGVRNVRVTCFVSTFIPLVDVFYHDASVCEVVDEEEGVVGEGSVAGTIWKAFVGEQFVYHTIVEDHYRRRTGLRYSPKTLLAKVLFADV